jgi:hypothetical protein
VAINIPLFRRDFIQKCDAESLKILDECEGAQLAMQTSAGGTCALWAAGSQTISSPPTKSNPTNFAFSGTANPASEGSAEATKAPDARVAVTAEQASGTLGVYSTYQSWPPFCVFVWNGARLI